MELSYFLAQLMGLSLALFALMGLMHTSRVQMMIEQFEPRSLLALVLGFLGVVAGLALVLSHNVWDGSWRVWVTLFGWLVLLKGLGYLFMPQYILKVGKTIYADSRWLRLALLASFIIGGYMALKGFGY